MIRVLLIISAEGMDGGGVGLHARRRKSGIFAFGQESGEGGFAFGHGGGVGFEVGGMDFLAAGEGEGVEVGLGICGLVGRGEAVGAGEIEEKTGSAVAGEGVCIVELLANVLEGGEEMAAEAVAGSGPGFVAAAGELGFEKGVIIFPAPEGHAADVA